MNQITPSRAMRVRCAIYTRKSSDEGLEQEFNSLHAQHDACAAYIRSQAHENWRALPEIYDDGGHSGGTLERPALKRLLEAVRMRRIDVIVIYKIDRLTRSLPDFARLAELFDAHGVSFVSVTQQFNTTTSMGRLMLNVLLSFAQFEREITAERIRDKIAASKKKGMWMGGTVPIGYQVKDRALVIDAAEAAKVQTIFRLYLEGGTVGALEEALIRAGVRTRERQLGDGRTTGGLPFSRGHLYRLLKNPIYTGRIAHKANSFPGLHEPIIDPDTWDRVQKQLSANMQGPRRRKAHGANQPGMLTGLLFDGEGRRFTLSHANKHGIRYHYYVCPSAEAGKGSNLKFGARVKRLPAREIEKAVRQALETLLSDPGRLAEAVHAETATEIQTIASALIRLNQQALADFDGLWINQLHPALARIAVDSDRLQFHIRRKELRRILSLPDHSGVPRAREEDEQLEVRLDLRKRGKQIKLLLTGTSQPACSAVPDRALVRALNRGHRWFELLRSGEATSVGDIAAAEHVTTSYVLRMLRLAFLSPALVEVILDGRQPPELSADQLTLRTNIPFAWSDQELHVLGKSS